MNYAKGEHMAFSATWKVRSFTVEPSKLDDRLNAELALLREEGRQIEFTEYRVVNGNVMVIIEHTKVGT